MISISFFLFFSQNANITGSNNRLQFAKKPQISTVSNTADSQTTRRFFFDILLGANCTPAWGQTLKSCRAIWLADACIVGSYDYDIKNLQSPLNTPSKYILLIYVTFLVKALHQSFHYILGIYIFRYTFLLSQNCWQDQFQYLTHQKTSKNISVIYYILFTLNFR